MMLLLNTILRQKLFAFVFTHSDEFFYVRELSSQLGLDVGNLSRELTRFAEDGIFEYQKKGSLKLYRLNKDYPLYNEYKSIVFKTLGVEAKLKSLVESESLVSHAYLYGSYAQNKEKVDSDIDILLVAEKEPEDFLLNIKELENVLRRDINYTLLSKEEFDEQKNVEGSFVDLIMKTDIINLKNTD